MQSIFKIVYKGEHTLLAALREVFFHVEFSYRHSKNSVDSCNGSLPPWLILLGAGKNLAEFKVNLAEIIAEHAACTINNTELCIILKRLHRSFVQDSFHLLELLRLTDRDGVNCWISNTFQDIVPHNAREILLKILVTHLVEVVWNIAELCPGLASPCYAELDGKYVLHLGLCLVLCVANHCKELANKVFVSFQNFL